MSLEKSLLVISMLVMSFNAMALPLPPGAPVGARAAAADPLFGNAITELYQYGPGIWSNPGRATETKISIITKVAAVPAAAAGFGSGLDRNPILDISAPFVPSNDLSIPAGPGRVLGTVYHPATLAHNILNLDDPLNNFGPAVGLGHPYLNALSVWFNYFNVPKELADPDNNYALVRDFNLVKIGFFNKVALTSGADDMGLWVHDYLALYESLKPGGADFIHPLSRGKLLLDALRSSYNPTDPSNPGNYYRLKKILTRHNKRFASFRAIGLNPMWDIERPSATGPNGPIAPRVSDYLLNSYARFFYRESYRFKDASFRPTALSLIYKTTANMLAFESGHMNVRYQPLDPSCRVPLGNACALAVIPPPILNEPFKVNFGSANEFAIVYDVLKFLLPGPDQANDAALNVMAGTNDVSPISGAINGRLGIAMATDMTTLVAVAKSIFDRAWAEYQALPAEFGGSIYLAPRASAAFVAAAAISGMRVDPVFWGHIAEAEQATMKIAFANYKNLVDGWFASDVVRNDFALSLSEFGSFNTNYGAATVFVPSSVPFSNEGLGKILNTAKDTPTNRMSLVRGPSGLISLQGDRFETATSYKLPDDSFRGTPFPNTYIELAQSGRKVIDGDLVISTGSGLIQSIDVDQVTISGLLMPFEQTIRGSYSLDSVVAIGGDTNFSAAMGAQTRARAPDRTNRIVKLQEDYKKLTGRFKPVSRFAGDSRFYTPALQYWLIISDKLNSTGLDPLSNNNPPQFSNISNMYAPEINKGAYRLKNLANVSYTNSGAPGNPRGPRVAIGVPSVPAPLGNILPIDAYHNRGYTSNIFPLLVQSAFVNIQEKPFISPTNSYIPSPVANPGVNKNFAVIDGDTFSDVVPSEGPGSIDCARLSLFSSNRDLSVNTDCP